MRETVELLRRLRDTVPGRESWFEALLEWYRDANEVRKTIEKLLKEEARCGLTIFVNGKELDRGCRITRSQAVSWEIPAARLRDGPNHIVACLDHDSSTRLLIKAASIEQDRQVPLQSMDFTVPAPKPTPFLALAFSLGAGFERDHEAWSLQVNGAFLKFEADAGDRAPLTFTLHVIVPSRGGSSIPWDDLLEEIHKEVRRRRREIEERLDRQERDSPKRERLERERDDLDAYEELHQRQIEKAFHSSDQITLKEIIQATGDPDEIIDLATARTARKSPRLARSGKSAGGLSFGGLVKLTVILGILGVGGYFTYTAWQRGNVPFFQPAQPGGAVPDPEFDRLLKAKGANTGEVQISLRWFNKNDLDLHVVAPSGETLSWGRRQSPCGGKLDVDMNVNYANASAEPVENVFWPQGKAPRGRYKIYVHHFTNHKQPDCQDPTRFTVRVVARGQAKFIPGEVVKGDPKRERVLVHELVVD